MKKRIFTLILLCSLFLILSTVSNADIVVNKYKIEDDFLLSSNNAVIEACTCSTFLDIVTVKNTGNVLGVYTIGSDSKYVIPYPGSFILEPNQEIRLLNYISVPCSARDFDFKVVVSTNRGLQKVMKQFVKVDKCQNLLLSPIIDKADIEPCQNATFSFLINNTDGFTESYSFKLDALSEFALFSENPAIIESMQSKQISFVINPDCKYYGLYNLTLTAEARYNKIKAFLPMLLNITPKYDFTLSGPDVINTCFKDESEFEYGILNLADFVNEYELSLDAPNWVKLSANKFSLEENQKGIFSLNIKPDEIGEFNIQLKAISKLGDLEAVKNITIKVDDCYKFFDLYFMEDRICKDDNKIHLVLANNGKFDENFELSLVAPNFIKLADEFVQVNKGQEKEIVINVGEDGRYNSYHLEATARIPGKDFVKKTVIDLGIVSLKDCYKPQIKPTIKFVDYSENKVELTLYNKGVKDDKYLVTAVKPDWIKFDAEQFFVKAGEATAFTIDSEPTADVRGQPYKVSFNIESDNSQQVYTKNFYLCVSKNNIIGKIASTLYKLWYVILLIGIIILALIIWLIIYLFKRKKLPKKVKVKKVKVKIEKKKIPFDKKKLKWIFIAIGVMALIIVAVVLFIFMDLKIPIDKIFGASVPALINETEQAEEEIIEEIIEEEVFNCEDYDVEDICDSSLYIKWNKNTKYVIELSDYFYDPDGDPLSYSSSQPDNIDITIEGSKAILTPEKAWTGVQEVVFSATDPQDNMIVSDIFVLHIIEGKISIIARIKALFG